MSAFRCCSSCCKDALPTLMLALYFTMLHTISSQSLTLSEDSPLPLAALVVSRATLPPPLTVFAFAGWTGQLLLHL